MSTRILGAVVGACISCGAVACAPPPSGDSDTHSDAAVEVPGTSSGAAGVMGSGNGGAGGASAVGADSGAAGSIAALQIGTPSTTQLDTISASNAALRVIMTDAPVAAEAVLVEFCGVEVQEHSPVDEDAGVSEHGWLKLSSACQSFDLLKLQGGVTSELGLDALPPGEYGQIRLGLTKASIQVAGQTYPLTIPSGMQSGIKIGHTFHVEAGGLTTLAMDFDAAKSIHDTGHGYVMSPVIAVLGELKEAMKDVRERAVKHEAERARAAGAGRDAMDDVGEKGAAGRDAMDDDGESGAAGRAPRMGSAGAPALRTESDAGAAADAMQPTSGRLAGAGGRAGAAAVGGRGAD